MLTCCQVSRRKIKRFQVAGGAVNISIAGYPGKPNIGGEMIAEQPGSSLYRIFPGIEGSIAVIEFSIVPCSLRWC